MLPVRRAPLWFHFLLHAGVVTLAWGVAPSPFLLRGGGAHDPQPSLAFFAFLIALGEIIWKGLEVAEKITVKFLAYSLGLLWKFANLIADGAHQLGSWAWTGLRASWGFLKQTYSHVLKPAIQKIWKWIDKAEQLWERTFGPVLKWLRRVRTWLLGFYAKFIRPVLDFLDVTRHVLRVLSSLGVDWARALDRKIADLEERIERPFRALLAKLNEVINIVNRVITADGLFQRLAFIKTLARDYREAWKQLAWGYSRHPDAATQRALLDGAAPKSYEQIRRDVGEYIQTGTGPDAAWISEARANVRKLYAPR